MPDLIYGGDSSWQPSGNPEPHDPPNELPTTREPWIGRQDLTAAFRAEYHIGREYLGGYIIDNTPRDNTPFPGVASVDLIIARKPDFSAFLVSNSAATKTSSKSATVATSGVIPNATSVDAVQTVSYRAPESTYRYFAEGIPGGARFNAMAIPSATRVIASRITARGITTSAGLHDPPVGTQLERTYTGAVAPAPLVSALAMPEVANVTSHTAEPISGTPWYRCSDTVTLELTGDT